MNSEHLSPRLLAVAEYVIKYSDSSIRLADIGSDHAYLPCYLALQNKIEYAIAGEVVDGPFQSAQQEVAKKFLTDKIDVRKGDGLSVINTNDAINSITICGMGGALIQKILSEADWNKMEAAPTLILQPNVAAHVVRSWISMNGYQIIDEQIVEDNHRLYDVIVARKAEGDNLLSERELLFGPINLKNLTDKFYKKWEAEYQNLQRILSNITQSQQRNDEKFASIQQQIEWIDVLLSNRKGQSYEFN